MEKLNNTQCRYSLLATALQREIEHGKFAVGKTLPTEAELCQQFNVSRCTVREALRQLRHKGLITSKQGSGSVVTAIKPVARFMQGLDSYEDLLEFLRQARPQILHREVTTLPAKLAKTYDLNPQQLWLHIQLVRFWGEPSLPTLLSDAYVDAKYSGIKDSYDGLSTLNEIIEQKYGVGIAIFQQEIQAVALNKQQSQLLQAKLHAPALQVIKRCYTANEELLVISCNISPADRYTYSTRMKISAGVTN